MGVDITGWVEVRVPYHTSLRVWPKWNGAVNVRAIADRNYLMFGLLFGVRNAFYDFPIPFAHRGIPDDRSPETWATLSHDLEDESEEYLKTIHAINASWLTWREIQTLGWDGQAQDEPPRIPVDWGEVGAQPNHEYTDWEDAPERPGIQVIARRRTDDRQAMWEHFYRVKEAGDTDQNGVQVLPDAPGYVFRQARIIRSADRHPDWDLLFKLMATLAEVYGENGVRLVAWFDQQ